MYLAMMHYAITHEVRSPQGDYLSEFSIVRVPERGMVNTRPARSFVVIVSQVSLLRPVYDLVEQNEVTWLVLFNQRTNTMSRYHQVTA